jgi:hypothetical protein
MPAITRLALENQLSLSDLGPGVSANLNVTVLAPPLDDLAETSVSSRNLNVRTVDLAAVVRAWRSRDPSSQAGRCSEQFATTVAAAEFYCVHTVLVLINTRR